MLGRLLGGKYQITRQLGEGGMGAVYEAQHTAIGRRVAVKTIRHGRLEQPAMLDRFRREAFAMAAIESEHVANILDAGDDPETGMAYLVMELLSGNDLGRVLSRVGPLRAQTALCIVHQALEGLRAAHVAGIAHRDIKPSNIFVAHRPDGTIVVKLVDFGIARNLAESNAPASKKVTDTGVVIGSPPYMSPEQFAPSATLDLRTDLWSLGVVLFEMLSGENPYARAADLHHMLTMICLMPPPSIREAAPWVPEDVAAIVGRAMRQKAAERYGSAEEMLADVARSIHGAAELTMGMFARMSETDKVGPLELGSAAMSASGVPSSATPGAAVVNASPPAAASGTDPMSQIGPGGTTLMRAGAAIHTASAMRGGTAPMPATAAVRAAEASASPASRPAAAQPRAQRATLIWGVAGGIATVGLGLGVYALGARSGPTSPAVPEAVSAVSVGSSSTTSEPVPAGFTSRAAPVSAAPAVSEAGAATAPVNASTGASSVPATSVSARAVAPPKTSAAPKPTDDPFGGTRKGK